MARLHFIAASLAAALGLAACGSGGSSPAVPQDVVVREATPWSLQRTSAEGLANHLRAALGAEAANNRNVFFSVGTAGTTADAATVSATAFAYSGTTVQEAGVDEADIVKTDGTHVFSLDAHGASEQRVLLRRQRFDAGGPALQPVDQLELPFSVGVGGNSLYLDAERRQVVALGQPGTFAIWDSWFYPYAWAGRAFEALVVGTPPDGALQVRRKLRIDAALVGSRRVGSTLYLVTRSYPQLPDLKPWWADGSAAANQPLLDALKPEQVLPTISVDGGEPQPLVKAEDCLLQPGNPAKSADIITIVAVDLASPATPHAARCFAGGTEAFYMSTTSLYLATTRYSYGGLPGSNGLLPVYGEQMSTDIHKFALAGMAITYRGSGNVAGHLGFDQNRKSFRMGEHEGALHVATQTQQQWLGIGIVLPVGAAEPATAAPLESPARLTILKEADGALAVAATLPNASRPEPLGKPGEQLYASRFIGSRAYLVTYRLTDPLYVLDLSNPSDPKVAGELHVEGYSDYLFPLSDNLLLGVGKDAAVTGSAGDGRFAWYQGVKVSLVDVSDPGKPTEAARAIIGKRGTDATVLHDHHGIALLASGGKVRVGLPVALHVTASSWASGLPNDYYDFTRAELRRFEVDLAARTLVERPALAGSAAPRSMLDDRAILWGEQVHWYQGGAWVSAGW
jgi:hypothetical protein